MVKPRVAVLRGGPSGEYEVSMKTGSSVMAALDKLNYQYKDIVITRTGEWLDQGRARQPILTLTGIDVVFIALHGEFGEDGGIQRFLSHHHVPYTGSRALASSTAFNKLFAKRVIGGLGIKTPRHVMCTRKPQLKQMVVNKLAHELGDRIVLKPVASGSSLDTYAGITPQRAGELLPSLLDRHEQILAEEYIDGKEVTIGVLDRFRNEEHYVLPAVEIVPADEFYSYDAKYSGESNLICPGRLHRAEREALARAAALIHRQLDMRHYSRSDFRLYNGELYYLETNSLPGLTPASLFPRGLEAVGARYEQLVDHLITLARA